MAAEPLPFWKSLVAGGAAGVVEIAMMYPTDVAKTRAQLNTARNTSMWSTLAQIARTDGPTGLYRGVLSPIVAEAPKRATKFAANDFFKPLLTLEDGSLPGHRAGMAGALAGSVEAFVNCPFETVKVRMQAKESRQMYQSTMDCSRQLLAKEGVAGLYRGIEPMVLRNAGWNGTYFACIGLVRNLISKGENTNSKLQRFVSGVIGGTLGVLVATPFDVVKSRMQNQQMASAGAVATQYRYAIPSLVSILRTEGLAAIYKGLGPRMVRLGPGGGIMIVAYDAVASWLRCERNGQSVAVPLEPKLLERFVSVGASELNGRQETPAAATDTEGCIAFFDALPSSFEAYYDTMRAMQIDGQTLLETELDDLFTQLSITSLGHKHLIRKHLGPLQQRHRETPPIQAPASTDSHPNADNSSASLASKPASEPDKGDDETSLSNAAPIAVEPNPTSTHSHQDPGVAEIAANVNDNTSGRERQNTAADVGLRRTRGTSMLPDAAADLVAGRRQSGMPVAPRKTMSRSEFDQMLDSNLRSTVVAAEPEASPEGATDTAPGDTGVQALMLSRRPLHDMASLVQTAPETSQWYILADGFLDRVRPGLMRKPRYDYFMLRIAPGAMGLRLERFEGQSFAEALTLTGLSKVKPTRKNNEFEVEVKGDAGALHPVVLATQHDHKAAQAWVVALQRGTMAVASLDLSLVDEVGRLNASKDITASNLPASPSGEGAAPPSAGTVATPASGDETGGDRYGAPDLAELTRPATLKDDASAARQKNALMNTTYMANVRSKFHFLDDVE
ncbi:uncharacterized protein MONBRDRAFT_34188 [Monosiga brevicollis MX1]|uniref:SAM domain-containing protein n=1 Tax=Monosiga brevicollis TaxID=81824 RepID=A9VA38_MONBE|nr:uncharacterized protein MONBRDRAFT_34188 [Monosiga brevicollis MX1]EDQ85660.1 predicted protein [Monosiga brevicollis MX1]|eukprot:XP_001749609.1 hypothetical protein [Monosiga brevicollis MX1]